MQENKPEKKNEIIEKLIKHFDGYINNFKDRLKINSIFNIFEDRIREDLNTLVKLSHDRYKSVKSGNSLNTMLEKQRPIYQELANNVLNEEFYKSSELAIEKKKFKHFTNEMKNKEIYNLRNKIKGKKNEKSNRSDTEDSLVQRARQRMMKKNHNTFKTKNDNLLGTNNNKQNTQHNTSKIKDNNYSPNNSMEKPIDSHHNTYHNNKDYAKIIENDRKLFFTQIEDYKKQLEGLRSEIKDDEDTIKVTKKIGANIENLNILNFKHNANFNIIEKKDDNDTVDIKKLVKMAKNGKKLPERKLKNLKFKEEEIEELEKIKSKHEEGNNIEVVRNEIINSFNIENIISNKKNVLRQILKDEDMPKIEDYEKMVKRNLTSEKLLSSTRIQQKPKDDANPKETDKVKDEYKKNYENKQNQWKMEDIKQDNLEKLEKEKKKETKLFLNQIKKRPRFAQIFVDQYSLRDENVNKNIIEISKYLGRNLYEKKNMNSKIDKYLSELEKNDFIKENESLENDDSLNREQIMIHEMILKNLENDEDEDKNYDKIGLNEKEEILALVRSGRRDKTKEEILKEDFEMFQNFKNDVIKKENLQKSLNKTQFKNQILNYSDYSANKNIHSPYTSNIQNNFNNEFNNKIVSAHYIDENRKNKEKEEFKEMKEILKLKTVSSVISGNNKLPSKLITDDSNNKINSNGNFNLPPIVIKSSSGNSSKKSSKKSSNHPNNINLITSSSKDLQKMELTKENFDRKNLTYNKIEEKKLMNKIKEDLDASRTSSEDIK